MSISKKLMTTGATEDIYVDDVFSTYVYEGNNTTQDIENGIDLEGEGGMVWIKTRNNDNWHVLNDTERGPAKELSSNATEKETPRSTGLTSFNSDGFTVGSFSLYNTPTNDYASWTFRKASSFFDVVTYTGNGAQNRAVPHNLGVKPGMVIVKSTEGGDWNVWHNSFPDYMGGDTEGDPTGGNTTGRLVLNSSEAYFNKGYFTYINEAAFGVNYNRADTNVDGKNYVAYVFAHDDSDESMIKCGSYAGNGSVDGPEIDLGFEPQWLLIKNIDDARDWVILDAMRGIVTGGNDERLHPNLSDSESGDTLLDLTSTGFQLTYTGDQVNGNGEDYIYMAIRRPNKPAEEFEPEELFAMDPSGSPTEPAFTSGFPVDMALRRNPTDAASNLIAARPAQGKAMYTDDTVAEAAVAQAMFDYSEGWNSATNLSPYSSWMWRRAPGFFDVVNPNSTSYQPEPNKHHHSLGVPPELIIAKCRDFEQRWYVGIQGDLTGDSYYGLTLNTDASANTGNTLFKWGDHTTDVFYSSLYATNAGYIHYLFASVPGICDIGSYTGNAGTLDIDCGFTNGARWVLIKKAAGTGNGVGDWYFTTDPSDLKLLCKMNSTVAQANYGSSYSIPEGFRVTADGGANLNDNDDTYIYMAIA